MCELVFYTVNRRGKEVNIFLGGSEQFEEIRLFDYLSSERPGLVQLAPGPGTGQQVGCLGSNAGGNPAAPPLYLLHGRLPGLEVLEAPRYTPGLPGKGLRQYNLSRRSFLAEVQPRFSQPFDPAPNFRAAELFDQGLGGFLPDTVDTGEQSGVFFLRRFEKRVDVPVPAFNEKFGDLLSDLGDSQGDQNVPVPLSLALLQPLTDQLNLLLSESGKI